jgi:uncharacterized coiled-coil DUF342 family protein
MSPAFDEDEPGVSKEQVQHLREERDQMSKQLESLKTDYIEARRQLNEHSVRIIKIKELESQLKQEREAVLLTKQEGSAQL